MTDLTLPTFTSALNTKFRLQVTPEDTMDVELIEAVDELEGKGAPPGRESFSLMFRGEHPIPLDQRIYSLEHDDMGTFDIFLVPVKQDDKGIYYQAIFNRLEGVQS